MNHDNKNYFPDVLAKWISFIFHPLFMPVYGMAIIFSAPTLFGYLPFAVKKVLLFILFINNVLVPLALFPFYINRKIISSWTINERKERIIPLVVITVLYAATSYIIFRFPIPLFIKSYIYSAFFLSLTATLINLWWKISLHSIGSGALLALVLILSYKMHAPLEWYVISAIIAAGLVLTSRLRLNYHNPLQVWVGLLTGIFGMILFMMFF